MAPTLLPEVFALIFSHPQKADLKPLGLVGCIFNDLIIPLLFDKIYISAQLLNLAVFRNISESPHLAKHVKELVYDATRFRYIWKEEDYHALMSAEINAGTRPPGNVSDTDRATYHQLTRDNEAFIGSRQDFVHLCNGLSLMPNITGVVVIDYWSYIAKDSFGMVYGVAGPLSRMWSHRLLQPQSTAEAEHVPYPLSRGHTPRILRTLVDCFSTEGHRILVLKYCTARGRSINPPHSLDLGRCVPTAYNTVFPALATDQLANMHV